MGNSNTKYFLADAAKMFFYFDKATEIAPNNVCLYIGESKETLKRVAPYLFTINIDFNEWFTIEGWGKSWGIEIYSDMDIETLKTHFRKLLMVKTENGEQLYFRFYDPRVLRIFLPTCDSQQLVEFFGPIEFFFMEDEDPNFALKFTLKNGELHTERIKQSLNTTVN